MRTKLAIVVAAITAFLTIKKALEGLAIIPIYSEGRKVASQGGDITPYIMAVIGILVIVVLPMRFITAIVGE